MEQIEEVFREAKSQYNGTVLLDAISRLEIVYMELAKLVDTERRNQRDQQLTLTRGRFDPETLKQIEKLSQRGFVSLGSALRTSRFVIESLGRCINGIRESRDSTNDFQEAFNYAAETLHYAYQTARPEM